MQSSSPFRQPGFLAFFGTQLASAFNDKFFKNALVLWISARQESVLGLSPAATISLCSGVFIAPFFLLSATAGQLADRYEKTLVVRAVKAAEVLILALGAYGFVTASSWPMLIALFLMGMHSALLGPVKYSILPQLVKTDELVESNALVDYRRALLVAR